jgi:hypothetical protein
MPLTFRPTRQRPPTRLIGRRRQGTSEVLLSVWHSVFGSCRAPRSVSSANNKEQYRRLLTFAETHLRAASVCLRPQLLRRPLRLPHQPFPISSSTTSSSPFRPIRYPPRLENYTRAFRSLTNPILASLCLVLVFLNTCIISSTPVKKVHFHRTISCRYCLLRLIIDMPWPYCFIPSLCVTASASVWRFVYFPPV